MGIAFAIIGILIYVTPSIIAVKLRQPNKGTVALVNLLLGWTVFGWIAAFILSLTGPAKEEGSHADRAA